MADLPEVLDGATFPEPLPPPRPALARDEAGVAFGVPGRGVQQAKTVQKAGSRKLVEAVDRGELSLGKAEQITKLYPDKKAQDSQVAGIAKSRMVTRVKGLTGEVEWYTPRPYLDQLDDRSELPQNAGGATGRGGCFSPPGVSAGQRVFLRGRTHVPDDLSV